MAERDLKKYLLKRVKELGGIARKVKWEGRNSAPDWRVAIPDITPFWIELKDEGKFPTKRQYREMAEMKRCGENVTWADCKIMLDDFIEYERFRRG